jgi:hypothetical protein
VNCNEIKEVLYDFLTDRLSKEDLQKIKAHVDTCKSCEKDLEGLRGTLTLLDKWKPPELSPAFRVSVLEALEERKSQKPAAVVKRMIEWLLQPQHLKRPLQGLAVAAMVLLVITVYRGLNPVEDRTIRDVPSPVIVIEAKKPIAIETDDVSGAFDKLKRLIEIHEGSMVRRRPVEGGMEVTIKSDKDTEEKFLESLGQLGSVKKETEGFKDGDGNIVVTIRKN